MLAVNNAPERARWEVRWIKNRKIQIKDCGDDLTEAIRIYSLVKGKRSGATLRCKNMGFPPPEKLRERIIKFDKPKLLHGKKVMEVKLNPMKKKNAEGIFWCPYCRELRRFVKKRQSKVDDVRFGDSSLECPMCSVNQRDHNVRKWNPGMRQIFYAMEEPIRAAPIKRQRKKYVKKDEEQPTKRRRRRKKAS